MSDDDEYKLPVQKIRVCYGEFAPLHEGESLFTEPTNHQDLSSQLRQIARNLGLPSSLVPSVLYTLWARRTLFDGNLRINPNFVSLMLRYKHQSLGETCAKWYFYWYERHLQLVWTPSLQILAAISLFDNERFVILACLDDVAHNRESTWISRQECNLCLRIGQHSSEMCYWYWNEQSRSLRYSQLNVLCGACGQFPRNLRTHTYAPLLTIENQIVRKRLILSAYVTRTWSNNHLRSLLDDYCDQHKLPRFVIPVDHRVGPPYS